MRPYLIALMAGAALLGATTAHAQDRMSLEERLERLDDRIDAGVRTGQLAPSEAIRLRADFRQLAARYDRARWNGLSYAERRALEHDISGLARQIRSDRTDIDFRFWFGGRDWTDERGAWVPVNRRQNQLERRIDRGVRTGDLTVAEATRLRRQYDRIARVEARYRINGLSSWERADLDRRFDILAGRIQSQRNDRQQAYGYYR